MKRHYKSYKNMTSKDFDKLKLLQAANLTVKFASDFTGRSGATVRAVYKADSWQAYKDRSKRPVVAENSPQATIWDEPDLTVPSRNDDRILSKLETIENCLNELLEVIKDKEAKANASFWRR